jgi:hypothetical protein
MKKTDAIAHFGGIMATADVLGISRQAVHKWPETVPINQAWKIERISGGKVPFRINDYRMKALK